MDSLALDNRELVGLLMLAALAALALVSRGARRSIRQVMSDACSPTILVPLGAYAAWIALAVSFAAKLRLWDVSILKATVWWVALSGVALFLGLNDALRDRNFFRTRLRRLVGAAVVVEFVAGMEPFPLYLEFPGQILALLAAVVVAAAREPQHARVKKVANRYLIGFGLAAVAWSTYSVATVWSTGTMQANLLREFAMPLWLTPVALAFMYGFALLAGYQSSFRRMRIARQSGSLLRQRLAVVARVNFRLGRLRPASTGPSAIELARCRGFLEAWRTVGRLAHASGHQPRSDAGRAPTAHQA